MVMTLLLMMMILPVQQSRQHGCACCLDVCTAAMISAAVLKQHHVCVALLLFWCGSAAGRTDPLYRLCCSCGSCIKRHSWCPLVEAVPLLLACVGSGVSLCAVILVPCSSDGNLTASLAADACTGGFCRAKIRMHALLNELKFSLVELLCSAAAL
jgi:hypothetical protein